LTSGFTFAAGFGADFGFAAAGFFAAALVSAFLTGLAGVLLAALGTLLAAAGFFLGSAFAGGFFVAALAAAFAALAGAFTGAFVAIWLLLRDPLWGPFGSNGGSETCNKGLRQTADDSFSGGLCN
jgi:hypothetical protein